MFLQKALLMLNKLLKPHWIIWKMHHHEAKNRATLQLIFWIWLWQNIYCEFYELNKVIAAHNRKREARTACTVMTEDWGLPVCPECHEIPFFCFCILLIFVLVLKTILSIGGIDTWGINLPNPNITNNNNNNIIITSLVTVDFWQLLDWVRTCLLHLP